MSIEQAYMLRLLVGTGVDVEPSATPDEMLQQVHAQRFSTMKTSIASLTIPRLLGFLSEGFKVIMWEQWLGEQANPVALMYDGRFDKLRAVRKTGSYLTSVEDVYHRCFDLLDRYAGEVGSGDIDDTLVAPYLALVIPQGNSND